MNRLHLPAAALLLAALFACDAAPLPTLRLFDLMDQATLEVGAPPDGTDKVAEVVAFDFDAQMPARIWFGRAGARGLVLDAELGTVQPDGGVSGGALRLGPGVADEGARAIVVVPVRGLTRVRVSGRVRLEHGTEAAPSSSLEVLNVIEHDADVADPTRVSRHERRNAERATRQVDASGWDRFELAFATGSSTRALELVLLHRSGGNTGAVTLFDDLAVESAPLSDADVYAQVCERYRPHDGHAGEAPWRLRVGLSPDGRWSTEVRDCVLLPPPARLSFPVRVPEAASAPVLRFAYGMVREAHAAAGDGAEIEVRFEPARGAPVALGSVSFDPKRDPSHRRWQRARFDLAPVAGLEGRLVFAAVDPPGEGPDVLDAVVLATPRIELAAQASERANVLLIGIDTLRADRMSAFGYARPTTPHLAKLADEGVRFPSTRSQAPWTLPSFASILTSLYPSSHRAGMGGHDEWTPIDPATTSIAEVLAAAGYETDGIVANGFISPHYGLDQGFEAFRSEWSMESAERHAPDVVRWIEEHRTTPWLFFWHIMDPHLPYSTPEGFRATFTEAGYDGRFARGRNGPAVPFEVLDPRPGRRWFTHEGPPPAPELDDRDRRFVNDYYDAEIAEMDAAVGRALDALQRSGQWDRTIVALIADHGEGLDDHGHYHHGYTLYDDQVHIPMIVRVPGAHRGRVVERPVAAIDLAPMILGALGIPAPPSFRGVDRLAADAPADDAYFIEYPTYDSSAQKAWIGGTFKYVHDPVFRTEALYDFGADPGERRDVKAEHPDVVARARAELDAFRQQELQKGRFHLRVRGASGQRLTVEVATDDLFDANFTSQPPRPETDFAMDLERRHWKVDTRLEAEELELVFWCRGRELRVAVALDGTPCVLDVGGTGKPEATPLALARDDIPTLEGAALESPAAGSAVLWLEAGMTEAAPVVLTAEQLERLRQLGYTR